VADLDGGQLLAEIENTWPKLGVLFRKYQTGINAIASAAGVAAVGQVSPPSSPQAVNVKVSGEMLHVSINDAAPLKKGIQYFTEIANNPSFSAPLVIHHGASRTSHPITLPTMDDDGNAHSFYARSYSQYPGSDPSTPVVYGETSPIPIAMAGTTKMTLLTSTGSGTASANGQQGGSGLGKVLLRPATGPKRQVGQ